MSTYRHVRYVITFSSRRAQSEPITAVTGTYFPNTRTVSITVIEAEPLPSDVKSKKSYILLHCTLLI